MSTTIQGRETRLRVLKLAGAEPAAADDLPELAALLAAMQHTPSTNHWDVVTSYSEEKLNQILQAQYRADKLVKQVKVQTEGLDPITGEKFPLAVTLELSAPSLKFVQGESGTCELTMPIESGSYQIAKLAPKPIAANVYQIVGVLPLAALSGRTGKLSTAGDVVTFGDDGGGEAHVILDFSRAGDRAYSVESQDGQPHTEDDILRIYVAPKLADYFSTNVSAIEYALAGVSDAVPSGDVVLQPKSFVFASAGSATTGVLSLYIQTEGGSPDPGTLHPVFQPGGSEMLRIPEDHTASIVLSHDLVVRNYLRAQLAKAGYGVSEIQAASGIVMHVTVGKSVIKDASHRSFWGNFSVDGIDASLTQNPLTVELKDGHLSVSWSYEQTLEWSESVTFSTSTTWGRVKLSISLSKSVPVTVSDQVIGATLAVGRSDYHVSTKAQGLKWYEKMGGGVESVPTELSNLSLDLPAIDLSLGGLGFFPITNLLFPGKKVIDVDRSTGVKVPYDLLLTGQIVDTLSAAGGPAATHLAALLERARAAAAPGPRLVGAAPPPAAPPARDAAALTNDLLTQDDVAATVFRLVAAGDPGQLQAWLQQKGYDVTPEGMDAVLGSMRQADGSDIRLWGGVYDVTAPDSMKGQKLVVSPKTGRVTLDDVPLTVTVEAADRIRWVSSGMSYDVTFAEHLEDDGRVDANTFAGTITTPAPDDTSSPTTQKIEGKQALYEPEKEWHEIKEIAQFGLIIGLVSGFVTIGMAIRDLLKGRKESQAQKQVADGAKALDRAVEMEVVEKENPEAALWEGIEKQVRQKIERSTNEAIDSRRAEYAKATIDDILGSLPDDKLNVELTNEFEKTVWSALKPQLEKDLGSGLKWMADDFRDRVMERVAKPRLEKMFEGKGASYVARIRESVVSKFRKEVLRDDAERLRDELSNLGTARSKTEGELEEARRQLKEVLDELKNEEISEKDREAAEKRRTDLETEIEGKQTALEKYDRKEREDSEARAREEGEAEEADTREGKAREEADRRVGEIFAE